MELMEFKFLLVPAVLSGDYSAKGITWICRVLGLVTWLTCLRNSYLAQHGFGQPKSCGVLSWSWQTQVTWLIFPQKLWPVPRDVCNRLTCNPTAKGNSYGRLGPKHLSSPSHVTQLSKIFWWNTWTRIMTISLVFVPHKSKNPDKETWTERFGQP